MVVETVRGQQIPSALNPAGYGSLLDLFDASVARYAERPAFTSFGRTLSYAELDRLAAAFAVYLQRHTDLQPGDRIAIQLPNLIQYPVVLYGALRAGLVVVNTNPLYTPAEMAYQFRDSGARALVIHKSMAHKAEQILADTEISTVFVTQLGDLHGFVLRTLLNVAVKYVKRMEPAYRLPGAVNLRRALMRHLGERPERRPVSPGELALLQYTGGTTGISKGAMLTHANLVSNQLQVAAVMRTADPAWARTVILPLPLYHIYAFTVAQIVLVHGGHLVLIPNPRDLNAFIKELGRWQMTTLIGINSLFNGLCQRERFGQLDFSQLRITLSGGMALSHTVAERWFQITGCEISEGYGLTEAAPVVCLNPPGRELLGCIGPPLPLTEVRIVDDSGALLPAGRAGELCVRGPQVMPGYWRHEAETRAAFTADGFLRTGDVAVREANGYLRIVDRIKDLVIVSGFNVYPNEVEEVINAHPGVSECAVIGIPDEECGEVIKLFVVPQDPDLDPQQLRAWCRERLTRYKIPRVIQLVDALPKSTVGKVVRRLLRETG